nr:hypothetical protein [Tanacetum cinerariifolium]
MHTRSSSNLPVEFPHNPSTSNPKRRNRRRLKQPFILEESFVETMVDQRTMAKLLRAPTEGYAEEIVIEPDQGKLTSIVMKDNLAEPRVHVHNVLATHPTLMLYLDFTLYDNSLPKFKTFYFDIKEKNSGSTTIHVDISLLDLECFNFDFKPDPGELTSIVDFEIRKNVTSAANVNLPPEEDHYPLFSYVVWIFFSFLTYPMVPPNLFSFGNEDTIFDPGIANYNFPSLLPNVSHWCETFMKFNVYPKLLNECPMKILSSSCSPMEQ